MAEINVGRVQGAGIRYSSISGNSSTNNFALSTLTPTVADLPLFADDLIIASNGLMYKSNANYTSANSGNLAVTYVTNIKGATGDKGDKGDTGATGDKGDKGDKGDTGDKGDKGDKGDTGAAGTNASVGTNGNAYWPVYTNGNVVYPICNNSANNCIISCNFGENAPSSVTANQMVTAIGPYVGVNGTATGATALGYAASVYANDSGTAIGATALGYYANVYAYNGGHANYATALGAYAYVYAYNGGYATCAAALGASANVYAIGSSNNCSYSTAIGYNARINGTNTNTIQLGAGALSQLRCAVNLTVTSDERDKMDMTPFSDNVCYDFLTNLNTFTYRRNPRSYYQYERNDENEEDIAFMSAHNDGKYRGVWDYDRDAHANGTKAGTRRRAGLSAQNVEEMMNKYFGSIDYADLVNDDMYDVRNSDVEIADDAESALTITPSNFIPIIISAMKAERKRIEELEARVAVLEGGA